MKEHVRSADFTGSLKSGTTALISALEAVASKGVGNLLVCSSDCRLGKAGSVQEMTFGDGAAAFLVSDEEVIAEYKGSFSTSYDFVDHYRGQFARFDRQWEDRWIRDMGYLQLIPTATNAFLDKYGLQIEDFAKVIYSCHYPAARQELNKKLRLNDPVKVQDPLSEQVGDMGAPQPIAMLVKALEDAQPGDNILVISYGSGCDVLYFQVTDRIRNLKRRKGISGCLANKVELESYQKYLVWRNILQIDMGLRGRKILGLAGQWRGEAGKQYWVLSAPNASNVGRRSFLLSGYV